MKNLSKLDNFFLISGVLGLFADTVALIEIFRRGGLTISGNPSVNEISEFSLILTAFFGIYSLTLLIWFLIRNFKNNIFVNDEYSTLAVPLLGMFSLIIYMPDIYFLSVFIAWLPSSIWIFAVSQTAYLAVLYGLLISLGISQYSVFFSLILESFFFRDSR